MTARPLAGVPRPSWRRRWRRWRRLPVDFVTSAIDGRRRREELQHIAVYCMFVGYPRAGKSLLRALLGAHPEIVISDELDALRYVQLGVRRRQLFSLILRRDREYKAERVRSGSSDYIVPTRPRGARTELRVIGDNKGGATTRQLCAHPGRLDRLRALVGIPVRLVHVTRNPYDNIASIFLVPSWSGDLAQAVELYEGLCECISALRSQQPAGDLLDLRHEDLLANPHRELASVCRFLGVEAPRDYLDDCAAVVRTTPESTRHLAPWTPELRARVDALVVRHTFLAGYSWTS